MAHVREALPAGLRPLVLKNLNMPLRRQSLSGPQPWTRPWSWTQTRTVRRTFTKVEPGLDEAVVRFSTDGYEFSAWSSDGVPDFLTWDSAAGYDYVIIPGYGRESDYAGLDVSGKIAVVQRGEIPYTGKYMAARSAGAAGLLVYNNEAGEIQMDLSALSPAERTIPAAAVNQTAGQAAMESAADGSGTLWFGQKTQVQTTIRNVRSLYEDGGSRKGCVYVGSLGDAGYIYHLYGRDALIGGVSDPAELALFDHWSCDDPDVVFTIKDPSKPYRADFFLPNHDVTVTAHWKEETPGENTYTVTAYGLYGDTMGITPGTVFTQEYAAGDLVRLQIGKRDGYTLRDLTLVGIGEDDLVWNARESESNQRGIHFTMPAGNVTVTVNWRASGSSSGGGGGSSSPRYAVDLGSAKNGTVTASPRTAGKGDTVTITVKPDSGYQLDDLTVTDKNGNKLKLTNKGNGQYTFPMPAGKADVKASFTEAVQTSPFGDVSASAYYCEAVKWAVENGITGGTGGGLFAPNQPCTRAQIVTFLWRTAGSPEPRNTGSFSDIPSGSCYAKAVAWAIENGITTGFSNGSFYPDAACTRAQGMAFLFRASQASASGAPAFSDVASDSYYAEAVKWATDNGITNGTGSGLFAPNQPCTRAQIVTFLWRLYAGR